MTRKVPAGPSRRQSLPLTATRFLRINPGDAKSQGEPGFLEASSLVQQICHQHSAHTVVDTASYHRGLPRVYHRAGVAMIL